MLFGYLFFLSGINNVTKLRLYYQSGSIVDYKINYDDTTSLIDNIDINYVFKSIFGEKMDVKYDYSVSAYLHAYQEDMQNIIWFRKYDLEKNNTYEIFKDDYVEIKDDLKIDYQKYKNELDNFLVSEEIEGSGYLNIQIRFDETFDKKEQEVLPKVINIDIMMDDKNTINVNNILVKDSYYRLDKHNIMNFIFMVLSMLCFAGFVSMLVLIIRQFSIIGERQNKYSKAIKKILSKYDYCIVKVNKLYVSRKYNMIYVDNFDDLLDIYNSKNCMINYKETKRGMESTFVIFDLNNAWIYRYTSDDLK